MDANTTYNTIALSNISLQTHAANQAEGLANNIKHKAGNELRTATEDFEAVFLSQMLGHMFSSVPVNEVFGGGHAEELWRQLMVDEYGKIMSKNGGIGIADKLYGEFLHLQEIIDE